MKQARGTLDLPQTSRATPVQCYGTHQAKSCNAIVVFLCYTNHFVCLIPLYRVLHRLSIRCNTLQHTATHYNSKTHLSYSSVSGPSSTPCGVATISRLLKGGPEPLKKEIHDILGSKREDRFSDPFFDYVQTTSLVRFSYLLRLCNFCKAPRDMRKFPQKCQKIAGC